MEEKMCSCFYKEQKFKLKNEKCMSKFITPLSYTSKAKSLEYFEAAR